MKPGYRWRILAHRDKGESVSIVSAWTRRAADRWWKKAMPGQKRPAAEREQVVREPSCFDELVIDNWFHLEQMDSRTWWVCVAGYHIWVRIPTKGEPIVTHDGAPLDTYGLRKD